MAKDLLRLSDLHDFSKIHDCDPITDIIDRTEPVSDKKQCQMQLLLQALQQIQDLRLNRHVQSGYRLITDDKFRIQGKSLCDPDPLTLSAGKLMRIPSQHVLWQSDHIKQPFQILLNGRLCRYMMVQHRLGENFINMLARIQGRIRILENHLQLCADLMHFPAFQSRYIASLIINFPFRRRLQPDELPSDR